MKRTMAAFGIAILSFACSPSEPDVVRFPGIIDGYGYYEEEPRITVTHEGALKVSVSISTFGLPCYTPGETEATVDGLEATVRVYDYRPTGVDCSRSLVVFEHTATLSFPVPGNARIVFHGLSVENDADGEPISEERSIAIE